MRWRGLRPFIAFASRLLVAAPPQDTAAHPPARMALLRLIEARPGIPLTEAKGLLTLGWGTAYHHVRALERAGLIQIVTAGRRRLLVPSKSHDDEQTILAKGLLRGATARRVALFVVDHPDARIADVAAGLGESPRVVYYHAKQLHEAGLLATRLPTSHFDLHATPLLQQLADELRALDAASTSDVA